MRTTPRILVVATMSIAALAAFTACSGSGQSRTDACIVVAQGLEDVQGEIAEANAALQTGDLDAMGESLDTAATALGDLAPEVTNADVAPILSALRTSIEGVRDAVADAGANGDAAAVTEALDASAGDLQNAALRFNDTCGG
ncbi:hypothetical protein [Microbacterium sp. PA5]|uniref:hypothetical protein n=1 Tax=Microbacterium sp. PA5 TaxID=3416654 RepID=UPI003CEEADBA